MGHNCRELLNRVILALDGELTQEQEREFLTELQNCDHCLEKYDIEKSFKAFLQSRITKRHVPDQIVSSIRSRIAEFQPGDGGSAGLSPPGPF